jgi:hypothetical protein
MRNLPRLGPCGCRRGIERDNCPSCEGTGQLIDWRTYHRLNPVIWIHPDGRRFSELQASRITLAPGERWTTERRSRPVVDRSNTEEYRLQQVQLAARRIK